MIQLSQKTTLTIDKDKYIIENNNIFELPPSSGKKEGTIMPTATLTMEEIQKFYDEYGINQNAPQTVTSEELDPTTYYKVPTMYEQVPLFYSDKVTR